MRRFTGRCLLTRACLFTALLACLPALILADEYGEQTFSKFSFDGSVRARYESKQDFDFDGGEQDYFLSQLRFGVAFKPIERSTFYLQLQDSRVFGEELSAAPGINKHAVPNTYADKLDVHQAFFEHDFGRASIRVGRQKFNLGDQRLLASLEWVNTARVHDGIRVTFNAGKSRTVDIFASALVPVDPDNFNNHSDVGNRYFDSQLHGIYVVDKSLLPGQFDYWYFYRENSDFDDSTNTVGGRFVNSVNNWKIEVQGAYQFGEFSGLDHSAYMIHVGVEKSIANGQLGVAYNLGSGDDNPSDGDHGTFDNLFPLNHAYYGFMDFFSLQNMHNLELSYKRTLPGNYSLRLAWQGFWINEEDTDGWYNAGLRRVRVATTDVDGYAGSEFDFTVSGSVIEKQLKIILGYSHFFTGDYISATGPSEDANFFFLQLAYTPNLNR